jgi:hypothetical protein
MFLFVGLIFQKAFINIMYINYILNKNKNKDLDMLKNDILHLLDNNQNTGIKINILKIILIRALYKYKTMYPKYLNYYDNFISICKIKNNDLFIQKFKRKIDQNDNLFVLYLLFIILEKYLFVPN